MQLRKIEVKNFRSIHGTERLEFNSGLTVILGPNNEGKSNLLKAVVLADSLLRRYHVRQRSPESGEKEVSWQHYGGIYNWDEDFPQEKQGRNRDAETVLKLYFSIQKTHEREINRKFKHAIKKTLLLTISIGRNSVSYQVKKPRLGALNPTVSAEIAFYIGEKFSLEYIPAIRPSTMSVDVVRNLTWRQLNVLREDDQYVEAMQKVQELEQQVLSALENDVQDQLKTLLPSVTSVKIDERRWGGSSQWRSRSSDISFRIDDGNETDLEAKGDGVKSLVAIALMHAASSSTSLGGLLLAIEEPEAHLHPQAVRQIADVLREMAEQHQVVITTHSPLLVARDSLKANILVTESRATIPVNIQEIREALGVAVGDNLVDARNILFVEGTTDQTFLEMLGQYIHEPFHEALQNGDLIIRPLDGANNLPGYLRLLPELIVEPFLLLDHDPKGLEVGEGAIHSGSVERKCVSYLRRNDCTYSELEDFLAPDFYLPILNNHFGVEIDETAFKSLRDYWTGRIRKMVSSCGKEFKAEDEKIIKGQNFDALEAAENRAAVLCPDNFSNLQAILKGLTDQFHVTQEGT